MPNTTCEGCGKATIANHIYYRIADPATPADWIPKSEAERQRIYALCAADDFVALAEQTAEAQMKHSMETSEGSGFVSVARCPVCLLKSEDPTVQAIIATGMELQRVVIDPRNENGAPYILDQAYGPGQTESESLVVLPEGKSLMDWAKGSYPQDFINQY